MSNFIIELEKEGLLSNKVRLSTNKKIPLKCSNGNRNFIMNIAPKIPFICDAWAYKDEGNANIILEYVGEEPFFEDKILRLKKKPTKPHVSRQSSHSMGELMLRFFGESYIRLPVRWKI
jgi:hypothetical protein